MTGLPALDLDDLMNAIQVAAEKMSAGMRRERDEARAECERLAEREPTAAEMERFLAGRDEIPMGDPYPAGCPTVRRCRHCACPVAGGPTSCVRCVAKEDARAECERLRAGLVEACGFADSLAEKPEPFRLSGVDALWCANDRAAGDVYMSLLAGGVFLSPDDATRLAAWLTKAAAWCREGGEDDGK